jgi:hypothetical protein
MKDTTIIGLTGAILIGLPLAMAATANNANADVVHHGTYTNQVNVCHHVPARNAGFIRVGNKTETVRAAAHVKCQWHDTTRTVVNTRTYQEFGPHRIRQY